MISDQLLWFIFCGALVLVFMYIIDQLLTQISELTSKLMSRNFIEYTEALKGPDKDKFNPKINESDIDLNRDIHPF